MALETLLDGINDTGLQVGLQTRNDWFRNV